MRTILFVTMMVWAVVASAAEWKPLPSTAEYESMVDVGSIKQKQKWRLFLLRRVYASGQPLPNGKEYFSTRTQYMTDCNDGRASLAVTAYYGPDRKLVQAQIHPKWQAGFKIPEAGSDLAAAMTFACERVAQGGGGSGQAGAAKPKVTRSSSGSGIVINRDGVIITNQHVVRQCDSYEVIDDANRKLTAALQTVDPARDLALLTVGEQFPAAAPLRKDTAPKLGEAVTVVGYPLVGVLGTRPSVNFGNVTSTVGVRGNPAQMQISVPVQRGNSGGPVLDQAGNVIGVVVAKLDALKLAQRTGDLPQNVNFAIRGDTVRGFLEAHKVDFKVSDDSDKLESTEIASRGAAVTVRVRCIREIVAQ